MAIIGPSGIVNSLQEVPVLKFPKLVKNESQEKIELQVWDNTSSGEGEVAIHLMGFTNEMSLIINALQSAITRQQNINNIKIGEEGLRFYLSQIDDQTDENFQEYYSCLIHYICAMLEFFSFALHKSKIYKDCQPLEAELASLVSSATHKWTEVHGQEDLQFTLSFLK
jgi:hypothetical protein